MKEDERKARRFWELASQYLQLTESVCDQIISSGNPHIIVFNGLDWGSHDNEYTERTKWSDHTLGVPLFFNFYHGLELVLKGFIVTRGDNISNHSLSELHRKVIDREGNQEFLDLIGKYLTIETLPTILADFFNESGSSVNDWYQAFKYPFDRKYNKEFDHYYLKYHEEDGVQLFSEMAGDIASLKKGYLLYAHEILK